MTGKHTEIPGDISKTLAVLTIVSLYAMVYTYNLYDGDIVSDRQLTLFPPIPITVSATSFFYSLSAAILTCQIYFLVCLRHEIRIRGGKASTVELAGGAWFFNTLARSYLRSNRDRSLKSRIEGWATAILVWFLPTHSIYVMFRQHSVLSGWDVGIFYATIFIIQGAIFVVYMMKRRLHIAWKILVMLGVIQSAYFYLGSAMLVSDPPILICGERSSAVLVRPGLTRAALDRICDSTFGRTTSLTAFILRNPLHIILRYGDQKFAIFSWGPEVRLAEFARRRLSRYSNDMGNVDGPNSYLNGPSLSDRTIRNAQFFGAFMKNSEIDSSDLSAMNAIDVDLRESFILDTKLSLATFVGSDLSKSTLDSDIFIGASFQGTKMNEAKITRPLFYDTNFSNSELHCAYINQGVGDGRVSFSDADLSNAVFSDIDLSRADFTNADLAGTCEFASKLPAGTNIPECDIQKVLQLCPNLSYVIDAADRARFKRMIREVVPGR